MNEQQQEAFDALQASVQQLQAQLANATRDATQQSALLQAAQAEIAALQQNQQNQNPGQNQQQNVTFATSPALANSSIVDLEDKVGIKVYDAAIEPVHSTKFDGSKTEVQVFRDRVQVKAKEQGWSSGTGNIFTIPDTSVTPSVTRDIIYRTQEVTTEQIETFAATFIGVNNRAEQNNAWACKSLFASISDKLSKRVTADKAAYTVNDVPVAALLFKVIILKSETAGKASINALLDELKDLDNKIKGMQIDDFNEFVNENLTAIASYGETVPDTFLIDYIFQGYKNSDDEVFNNHFIKQQRKFLKEEVHYTAKSLLEEGEKEFNSRRLDKSRPWGALSKEEEQIIALTANLQTMEKKFSQLSKSTKALKNTPKDSTTRKDTQQERRTSVSNVPKWKLSPMYKGKKYKHGDSIEVNGKTFYFCKYHHRGAHHNNKYSGMWVTHKPDECNKKDDDAPVANQSTVEDPEQEEEEEDVDTYQAALAQVELDSDEE